MPNLSSICPVKFWNELHSVQKFRVNYFHNLKTKSQVPRTKHFFVMVSFTLSPISSVNKVTLHVVCMMTVVREVMFLAPSACIAEMAKR